ncbi:hypothetical protein GOP47_0011187 [Adiantum capillus-veneris]|uniref:Uncharacterized protein n=1 Tax=Adiantum capillus-veneris TaxID=13818 RepID=A0A9D4USA0_ADICA|nr:hypothetical protein GOP47_0011187 [Adiantum capillus-veneris]
MRGRMATTNGNVVERSLVCVDVLVFDSVNGSMGNGHGGYYLVVGVTSSASFPLYWTRGDRDASSLSSLKSG